MNCWEHMNCGRECGGANAEELGVCPAYTHRAGEACWLVAGTFCKGEVQGTFAEKKVSCMGCEFYQRYALQHHTDMRGKFAWLLDG